MTKPEIVFGTRVLVYVQPSGTGAASNAKQFEAQITEISTTGGARDTEEIKTLGNNEIIKRLPQEQMETEISFIYTDPRFFEIVAGGSDAWTRINSGSYPVTVAGDAERLKYRIWVEASGTSADDWKIRKLWKDGYGVDYEDSVDAEGHLAGTLRFRCSAENYSEEWTGSYTSAPLSTLPSY